MNYADIKKYDIANGVGVRVSLFVSGCRHHCKGCFNSEAWDFSYGKPFTDETIDEIMSAVNKDYIRGLSLLGGEPLDPDNRSEVLRLLQVFRARFPEKTVWCYSGYFFDTELLPQIDAGDATLLQLLELVDVLVDGRFVEAQKDLDLRFRGSSNQRILDVPRSLQQRCPVLLPGNWSIEH